MICKTQHNQLIICSSSVALFWIFLLKRLEGISIEDIIGNGVMLWTSIEVLKLKYIPEDYEELHQCLGRSGIEYQNIFLIAPPYWVFISNFRDYWYSSGLLPIVVYLSKYIGDGGAQFLKYSRSWNFIVMLLLTYIIVFDKSELRTSKKSRKKILRMNRVRFRSTYIIYRGGIYPPLYKMILWWERFPCSHW